MFGIFDAFTDTEWLKDEVFYNDENKSLEDNSLGDTDDFGRILEEGIEYKTSVLNEFSDMDIFNYGGDTDAFGDSADILNSNETSYFNDMAEVFYGDSSVVQSYDSKNSIFLNQGKDELFIEEGLTKNSYFNEFGSYEDKSFFEEYADNERVTFVSEREFGGLREIYGKTENANIPVNISLNINMEKSNSLFDTERVIRAVTDRLREELSVAAEGIYL